MEFLVEKVGMSRTVGTTAHSVTLLRVLDTKVCELKDNGSALVAYHRGKNKNKPIEGQQKKYKLSAEFNNFATISVKDGVVVGDLDLAVLADAKTIKSSFMTKGRGFTGSIKRWNQQRGPETHGSHFHRAPGSLGWITKTPGRVMKGKHMPGHYGHEKVTCKNEIVSFDKDTNILVVKGSISGPNGALGKIRVVK